MKNHASSPLFVLSFFFHFSFLYCVMGVDPTRVTDIDLSGSESHRRSALTRAFNAEDVAMEEILAEPLVSGAVSHTNKVQ